MVQTPAPNLRVQTLLMPTNPPQSPRRHYKSVEESLEPAMSVGGRRSNAMASSLAPIAPSIVMVSLCSTQKVILVSSHCTHLVLIECTYDQPSNRRRNPAPQYIEALESRLQKAEAVLRSVLPTLDLDDPKFDAQSIQQLVESARSNTRPDAKTAASAAPETTKPDDDAQLQSMVDRTGALDIDDTGNWDFHGHSSGYVFMRRFRAQFGDQLLPDFKSAKQKRTISQVLESPRSAQSSPYDFNLPAAVDLPPRGGY